MAEIALAGASTIGTLSMNMTVYAVPGYFTASVPEPTSTMGLGLLSLFGISRRNSAQAR